MSIIFLARHGETYWNVENRIQGQTETDLTRKGTKQANWLAEYFKSKSIHSIICSELTRSRKTAEQINKYHHLTLEVNPNINECNWGEWEGLTHTELIDEFPVEYNSRKKDIWLFRPQNGESYEDLNDRLCITATEFAHRAIYENIVVVGHAMVNKVLIGLFLDLPPEEIVKIAHPNDIVYLIWKYNSSWKIGYADNSDYFNIGYVRSKGI